MIRFSLIIAIILLLSGCSSGRSEQSFTSKEYERKCQSICQIDFGTDVHFVGILTGKCYCK